MKRGVDKPQPLWYNKDRSKEREENKMKYMMFEELVKMVAYNELTEAEAEEIAEELLKDF
jgi:hypothetical protein